MFREEAEWMRCVLSTLDLDRGTAVLDVGSSTLDLRTREQPYIEESAHAPLRARGLTITSLDCKPDPGVDVVLDLTDPACILPRVLGRRFDLVLCTNVLSFVRDRDTVLRNVTSAVEPGGYLVLTTVANYRRTLDPVDNLWRPSPTALLAAARRHDPELQRIEAITLRIEDPSKYRGPGRKSSVRVWPGWFLPVPKATDRLRPRFERLKWRQSCVLARKSRREKRRGTMTVG